MFLLREISKDLVDQFVYDDGLLYWKELTGKRKPGPVGFVNSGGYLCIRYKGDNYKVHRIIWAMHHGDTNLQIDHINRCRSDNRIENLRAVTPSANKFNSNRGVTWMKQVNKWRVQWGTNHVCLADDLFEAWCIRKSKEASYANT